MESKLLKAAKAVAERDFEDYRDASMKNLRCAIYEAEAEAAPLRRPKFKLPPISRFMPNLRYMTAEGEFGAREMYKRISAYFKAQGRKA